MLGVALHHGVQRCDHGPISLHSRLGRPIVRRPREPSDPAGVLNRQTALLHEDPRRLPPRGRRYSFRLSTSLIAAFSSARSVYIRFSFAFSASSSRSRFKSATVAPAYFRFQAKYVCRLIPCLRMISATGTPASPSFRTATICDSENRDFRIGPSQDRPTRVHPCAVHEEVTPKRKPRRNRPP